MSEREKPKWKKFEEVVFQIQKSLVPRSAKVTPNDQIFGHDSKTNRQIDISIRIEVPPYSLLIVIDCKDYKNPVDVKDVGEFASVVKDIKANKGAMVSSNGFTDAAIEMAKSHGLDTFRYVNTESIDWKSYASIPALLVGNRLKGYQLQFHGVAGRPWELPLMDFRELKIHDSDGKCLGPLRNVIAQKWNSKQIKHEPGTQHVEIGKDLIIKVQDKEIHTGIVLIAHVERHYYFGQLPVRLVGLKDEQTGGVVTREMTTDFVEPALIERGEVEGWNEIQDPEKLSVRPVLRLGYSDVEPEESATSEAETK